MLHGMQPALDRSEHSRQVQQELIFRRLERVARTVLKFHFGVGAVKVLGYVNARSS